MSVTESGLAETLAFLQSEEFDKLITATKEFWDECDYMGKAGTPEEEIGALREQATRQFGVTVPEGYIAFLRKERFVKCGGFELYPCGVAADMESGDGRYFRIGREHENDCAYDTMAGKYVILQKDAEKETYESFAALFKTVMQYVLPDDKLYKLYPALKGCNIKSWR